MGKFIDISGKTFGKLKVVKRLFPNNKHNNARWECKCECGNTTEATHNLLVSSTKPKVSCGCLSINSRFQKGLIPHNKGIHLPMSPKCEKTYFPKGNKPHNATEDYSPRVVGKRKEWCATLPEKVERKDHRGRTIKVRKRTSYARALWLKNNGSIPKGMIVFNNGNPDEEPALTNLELITRAELLKRNRR